MLIDQHRVAVRIDNGETRRTACRLVGLGDEFNARGFQRLP